MRIGLLLDLLAIIAFGAAAIYSEGWYRLVAIGLIAHAFDGLRLELGDMENETK